MRKEMLRGSMLLLKISESSAAIPVTITCGFMLSRIPTPPPAPPSSPPAPPSPPPPLPFTPAAPGPGAGATSTGAWNSSCVRARGCFNDRSETEVGRAREF